MSKRTPGSIPAMKAAKKRYAAERERARQKRDRRAEIASYFHLDETAIDIIDPDEERRHA